MTERVALAASTRDRPTTLVELALLFLRLGATAFGGPAAHVAMMEDEVVRRRRWLSEERFLDLLGATNLIPARIRRKWPSTSGGRGGVSRVSSSRACRRFSA